MNVEYPYRDLPFFRDWMKGAQAIACSNLFLTSPHFRGYVVNKSDPSGTGTAGLSRAVGSRSRARPGHPKNKSGGPTGSGV
jgi:hypothetical protein